VAYLKSLIICYKDTASRVQNKTNLFVFYAEPQRIFAFLCKFTASREQNKTNLFVFYAKAQRIFAFHKQIYKNIPKPFCLTSFFQ